MSDEWDGILGTIMTTLIIGVIGFTMLSGGLGAPPSTHVDGIEMTDGTGGFGLDSLESIDELLSTESTLGDQAKLTGASDSSVDLSDAVSVGDTYSACTYAAADQTVVDNNETRTVMGLDYATIAYNGTNDTYVVWDYDDGTRSSHRASVAAPTPTKNTLVCGHANETHLWITANTTSGTPVALDGSGQAANPNGSNWKGTMEETRVYYSPLNDSQIQEFVNNPVLAVSGGPSAARIMFDVEAGNRGATSVPAYFAGADATLSNATLVDGFTGPDLTKGTDYERNGETMKALEGGILDGDGDVLFVTYKLHGAPTALLSLGIGLFVMTPLVLRLLGAFE